MSMTDHKNTNPFDEQPISGPNDGNSSDWEHFLSEHADDMDSIEHSRNAKKFEKHVKREQKKAALRVEDLTADAFSHAQGAGHGPRDFTGRSWLDTDDVMDQDSDFIPPNPALGPIRTTTLLYVTLLVIGILGLVAALFIAHFAPLFGTIGGALSILGAAGLFSQHRGHEQTKRDAFDDGSRV